MDQPREPDEWLMDQVAQGRRECLTSLVERHGGGLFTFIWRMVGHRQRAEELFQEVFLTIWSKRRLYEYPRPFRAWLFAIAANCCRADFRRAKPGALAFDEAAYGAPTDGAPSPSDQVLAAEQAKLVGEGVAALPPQQRMVVGLRIWNGLPYAEIAAIAGCSEATVRSHMHHALAGLRKFLEPRM